VTAVEFHFNVSDRLVYACRLLRKAVAAGAKVVVTGSADLLQQFDALLWAVSPTDFVPHCYLQSEVVMVAVSPVILTEATSDTPHHHVLVNLGYSVPEGYASFERVIEIVTPDAEDRKLARERWKQYTDAGIVISRRDLNRQALPQAMSTMKTVVDAK
jgi:DNA polymerase-3 subunit chi